MSQRVSEGRLPRRPTPQTLNYRRIVLFLVALVIVPSVLLSAIGVIMLVAGEEQLNILLGILVLCFTGAVVSGVVLVWVFARRDAKLNELQADFVSKVSHELRTPLTSIRMFTETLALRRGNPAVEEKCIEALTRESRRLQDLIDRLLDWGRMESGRRLYVLQEADIKEVIEGAVNAYEPLRERRQVSLDLRIQSSLGQVICDSGAVKDAIVNLLSNAYKYGGEPPAIRLWARETGGNILISVSDNGQGIDRREHKRIFEKFYRIDDRLSREREGSGLGLAIVAHVIRAHGGSIEVDSALGRGSTFTLSFPRQARPPGGE
ncbi:MAG: HAMP domain-containing histidine kinase [Polyangiaceae bacterium]|jgi:two-component system phosphate regulon sensor histidine kinase PhoR|nr:HAMP domain-containing histidine kinase [Polyangiaceae bacterium]